MKHRATLIAGVLLAAALLLYMVTYQVRFDQFAVVTTFDEAGPDAVKRDPGLHWKWPYPIQDVRLYDTRVQVLDLTLEQHATRDQKALILGLCVRWRIEDPLALFRSLKTMDEAENQLRSRIRDAASLVGKFSFEELASRDPAAFKLPELEKQIQEKLAAEVRQPPGYGLAVLSAGVTRMVLPEGVTPKVFDLMRTTRAKLAENARSEGLAAANAIRSTAQRDHDIILAFADRYSQAIRAEAYKESAEWVKQFEQDESFAIYLQKLDALKKALQRNTTFVLDTQTAPFDLFARPAGEKAGGAEKPGERPRGPGQ